MKKVTFKLKANSFSQVNFTLVKYLTRLLIKNMIFFISSFSYEVLGRRKKRNFTLIMKV